MEANEFRTMYESGKRNFGKVDLNGLDLRGALIGGAILNESDLSDADLSGADLSWAEMRHTDLRGAILAGANLSRADLSAANLRGCDLKGANLSWAGLARADLSCTDLSRADMRGAILNGANLSEANVRGTDLAGACLNKTNFTGTNLNEAKGLLVAAEWLGQRFKTDDNGLIVYTAFVEGEDNWSVPPHGRMESHSLLARAVNSSPTIEWGEGLNFATLDWITWRFVEEDNARVWRSCIHRKDRAGIVVPYYQWRDGHARCQRLELLEEIDVEWTYRNWLTPTCQPCQLNCQRE